MRRALAVALALSLGFAAPRAHADGDVAQSDPAAEARQQYQAGMQAYQAKRFVEAALHFEAAAAQKAHAVTLYTAALCWEQANKPERSADDFVRALAVPGPGLSAAQTQNAHDRLASLETTMGTLEVIAPDGWHVQIDANTETTTPAHLHALPGVHSLAGQGPTGPVQHQDVTLEAGKVLHVELTPKPVMATQPPPPAREPTPFDKEPPPAAPPPTQHGFALRRVVAVGVAGVGVGSLAFGAVLGTSALSARDAYNAAPTRQAYDHATSLATWTDVALIAGGVCVAGGVVLWFWPSPKGDGASAASRQRGPHQEPEASVALVPTLNGALVRGTF